MKTAFCRVEYSETGRTGKDPDARLVNIRFANKCYMAFACEGSALGAGQTGYNVWIHWTAWPPKVLTPCAPVLPAESSYLVFYLPEMILPLLFTTFFASFRLQIISSFLREVFSDL